MKVLILLSLLTLPTLAATWKADTFEVNLTQTHEGDWLSQDCLKNCKIDVLARANLKEQELTTSDLSGGMNPGSVLCRRIQGQVIYLKFETTSQAFCSLGSSTVSLSRLIRLI